MSSSLAYDYLFYFHSGPTALVEVKVTSLAQGAALDKVYHWLHIEGGKVQKLQFRSMREEDGRNYREFAQGKLSFDTTIAQLQLHDPSVDMALTVEDAKDIPADLDALVCDFLQQVV